MLTRTAAKMVSVSLVFAACTVRVPESEDSESSNSSRGDGTSAESTDSPSPTTTSSTTTPEHSSTDRGQGESGTSSTTTGESSIGSPVDPCTPGTGEAWSRQAAYLRLANAEDFTTGPLDLRCSIDRSLNPSELQPVFPPDVVGAVELICEVPETNDGTSVVYVGTTLPEAVGRLEALVGLVDVQALFYGGSDVDTVVFGIRDETGPLFISQGVNCDGQVSGTVLACSFFPPPFQISPTWSEPLTEARLADIGCGTRPWEYNKPPALGTYDMTRLAVRFETDEGEVDALDHHITPLNIEGSTYEFFAIEAVGEVDDEDIIFGNGYTHFARFLITRSP